MPWLLLIWLLAFLLQSGLLGICMFQLLQLSDLEQDFVNPHEAAANINRVVLPEYVAQALLTALMLCTGHWVFGGAHAVLLAFHVQQYMHRRHLADVTEIFRQVGRRRKVELFKLALYLVAFVWAIYRLIEVMIVAFLTPSGRKKAARVLREAASQLHR